MLVSLFHPSSPFKPYLPFYALCLGKIPHQFWLVLLTLCKPEDICQPVSPYQAFKEQAGTSSPSGFM